MQQSAKVKARAKVKAKDNASIVAKQATLPENALLKETVNVTRANEKGGMKAAKPRQLPLSPKGRGKGTLRNKVREWPQKEGMGHPGGPKEAPKE